jgi:hypothetical protein
MEPRSAKAKSGVAVRAWRSGIDPYKHRASCHLGIAGRLEAPSLEVTAEQAAAQRDGLASALDQATPLGPACRQVEHAVHVAQPYDDAERAAERAVIEDAGHADRGAPFRRLAQQRLDAAVTLPLALAEYQAAKNCGSVTSRRLNVLANSGRT